MKGPAGQDEIEAACDWYAGCRRRDERWWIGGGGEAREVAAVAAHLVKQGSTVLRRGALLDRGRRTEGAHKVAKPVDIGAPTTVGGVLGIVRRVVEQYPELLLVGSAGAQLGRMIRIGDANLVQVSVGREAAQSRVVVLPAEPSNPRWRWGCANLGDHLSDTPDRCRFVARD